MYKAYSRYYMRDGLTRFSPGLVTRGLVVGADGVDAEESLASDRHSTALGLASNLVADAGKSLALAWARRRDDAIEVSKAKNIDLAALGVGVEQARGAEVGEPARGDAVAVAVHGGSGKGSGEEESGDGEELHFGFV